MLRIARDPEGRDLIPTQDEARIEAEQKLAESERKLAAALAELERLRK